MSLRYSGARLKLCTQRSIFVGFTFCAHYFSLECAPTLILSVTTSLHLLITHPSSNKHPTSASTARIQQSEPEPPSLSDLHPRNREVALNLLNCSNKTFIFTSSRFSGIKVSSRLPLFTVLFRRRFTVTKEMNLLVSGPWVWQTILSFFHCPSTCISNSIFVHCVTPALSFRIIGIYLSADPGFRQIRIQDDPGLKFCPDSSFLGIRLFHLINEVLFPFRNQGIL
jgi:hypothetical protein